MLTHANNPADAFCRHCVLMCVVSSAFGMERCELLKNLGLTGFEDIGVVDLDILGKSNPNRQFLF